MGQWKRVLGFMSLGVILSSRLSSAEQPGFGFLQDQQRPPVPRAFFQASQGPQPAVLPGIEDIGRYLEAIESASWALVKEFTLTRQRFPWLLKATFDPYFSQTAGKEGLGIGSLLFPFMTGDARFHERMESSSVLPGVAPWTGPKNRAHIPYNTLQYWIGRLHLEAKTIRHMHADLLGMMQNGVNALTLPDGRVFTADQLFSRMRYRYQQLTSAYITAVAISVFYIHVLEQSYFVELDGLTVEGNPTWTDQYGKTHYQRRYQKGPRLACSCYRGGNRPLHRVCPTLAAQLTRFRDTVLGVMEAFHVIHHSQEFYVALQIEPPAACLECLFEQEIIRLLVNGNSVDSFDFLPLVSFDFRNNTFAGLIPGKGWSERLTAYQNKIQIHLEQRMFSDAPQQSIFGESVGQGLGSPFPGPLPQGGLPGQRPDPNAGPSGNQQQDGPLRPTERPL